ncbi:MAG: ECF transporter S component [Clostridia bacterium]|nr:ECF transporter S component [Clostridia bacterium]
MTNSEKRKQQTRTLVLGAVFTALVIVLQFLGSFIRFGMFSISLVLLPIIIGAATCGYKIGAWLGFVFGFTVLVSGDATAFLTVNYWGTIATVLVKGTLCGLAAGLIYKAVANRNQYLAVMAAAIICPVVNTGIFLLGCKLFFFETIKAWGAAAGFNTAAAYMFLGLAGGNFLFELGTNLILSPAVVRILKLTKIHN